MRRTLVVGVVLLAVAGGTACSSGSTKLSVDVNVDGVNASPPESFTAYFPNNVSVHPGDTVNFKLQDNGEPHTVTLGTLADAAVTAATKAGPNSQAPLPEDAKLPQLFPQGPGDAVQAAAQPCFLATGDAPLTDACSAAQQAPQPAFDGTQTYFNSGWLASAKTFAVKLSSTIKPGKYQYLCLLHREGMSGTITVVDSKTKVPSAGTQAATGKAELAKAMASLQPAIGPLALGKNPDLGFLPSGSNIVLAGSGLQAVNDASIVAFGPDKVSVPVGGSVTWLVIGDHTISFNAPAGATDIRQGDSSHLSTEAASPAGGPGQPASAQNGGPPPSGPPPAPVIVDGGSWDGGSFRSSGLFLSFPPALSGYKLTFTKAGSYEYHCLIHDQMKGTVVVG